MNRKFLLLFLPLTLAILVIFDPFSGDRAPIHPQVENGIFLAEDAEPNALAHPRWHARSGPEWQRWFFADWHYPYGAVLPLSVEWDIWSQIRRLPLDTGEKFVDSWELLGPSGVTTPTGAIYSGRILDLDALAGPELTIAAASGGLWTYAGVVPAPLTDDLSTQWVSTLAYDPDDSQTILIGTGEYIIRGGRGVFKSTNGGASWGHRTMSPNPGVIFRIRYGSDRNTVHAVTDLGYYRSTDDGDTWTRIFFQDRVTDIAVVPAVPTPGPPDPDVLYVTAWDEGLYLSIDAGLNWGKAIAGGIPTSDVARGAVSVCAADHGVIYTAFAQQSFEVTAGDTMFFDDLKGVYRTANYGYTWADITPTESYMGKQAWYNNVIAVCPTDPNLVLAAGVSMMRSENGGASWTKIEDPHVHGDFHALQWHPNGIYVWAGHDGGWCWSNDRGRPGTWFSNANTLPISQFTGFDVSGHGWNQGGICGGTQDNGVFATANGGTDWFQIAGGDGGDCIYRGLTTDDILFACGWIDGARAFDRYRSVDGGASFTPFITGLDESPAWYPSMRKDGDGRIFTHDHQWVYGLSPQEDRWIKLHNDPFAIPITEITVSPVALNFVIWVCQSDYLGSWAVAVFNGNGFVDRSAGLPAGIGVRKIVPHPSDSQRAYALIEGLVTPGQKIYRTTNQGQSWINITGDLPNVPLSDLVVHVSDDNRLFVGSEYGMYRTIDGGGHWLRWNNGLPEAAVVTEMKIFNVGSLFPIYDIVASTYGRGIWRRSMLGDEEPTTVPDGTPTATLTMHQAAPNPFNPTTMVQFELGAPGRVTADVYDTGGRLVRRLFAGSLPAGPRTLTWDGRDDGGRASASGVYLVRVSAGEEEAVQKVTLAR